MASQQQQLNSTLHKEIEQQVLAETKKIVNDSSAKCSETTANAHKQFSSQI
jgi:hypothetical protein